MLKKIQRHATTLVSQCKHACRLVAVMTAGEMLALVASTAHADFVTMYLIASTWVKDAFLRHHDQKIARDNAVVRHTIHIKGESNVQ